MKNSAKNNTKHYEFLRNACKKHVDEEGNSTISSVEKDEILEFKVDSAVFKDEDDALEYCNDFDIDASKIHPVFVTKFYFIVRLSNCFGGVTRIKSCENFENNKDAAEDAHFDYLDKIFMKSNNTIN